MLFFKRLVTMLGMTVLLWVVLTFGAMMVGGGMAGVARSQVVHATDFQSGYAAGNEAGREFAQRWAPTIIAGALGVSLLSSAVLSFSGVLPWCRRVVPGGDRSRF